MITVSIVTYHTDDRELAACLECLASDRVRRIYIVDNSRSENTRRLTHGREKVVYIPSDNRGYGAGHNQAIRLAEREAGTGYHLVMNSDVSFDPGIIERIEGYMDAHPDVGALQPLIFSPDGSRQFTCRALPTPLDVFARRFLPARFLQGRRDRYLLKHLDERLTWNIPYHQGSFMFMRMDALRETGYFDERFFMYPEDIDMTRRIHRKFKTVQWPGAAIVHDHRADSYKSLRMTWIHAVNMVRYFNKWGWVSDRERDSFNSGISVVK